MCKYTHLGAKLVPRGSRPQRPPPVSSSFSRLADLNGFLILRRLAREPEPVTMGTFTAFSETTPVRARLARRELLRLGLVHVEEQPHKGPIPRYQIHVTAKGRTVAARLNDMDKTLREG